MDIVTAFRYRECGYRIRRIGWRGSLHYIHPTRMTYTKLSTEDVLAEDWIILTDGITIQFPITYSD